jgi:hypothetical protein
MIALRSLETVLRLALWPRPLRDRYAAGASMQEKAGRFAAAAIVLAALIAGWLTAAPPIN